MYETRQNKEKVSRVIRQPSANSVYKLSTKNQQYNIYCIQCCKYDSSCTHKDPCPIHEYSQVNDSTKALFIAEGKSYIAEEAMRLQQQGKIPTANQVRVKSYKSPYKRSGSGLDELIPTNKREMVAKSKIPGLPGIQSGARIPTDRSVLKFGSGVCGHTGMFPKKDGHGSTHLKGQSKAHDIRRLKFDETWNRTEAVSNICGLGIKSEANGKEIMESSYLIGAIPNFLNVSPIGKGAQDPTRINIASIIHESREHSKSRLNSYTDFHKLPRLTSPERNPITEDGEGGDYGSVCRPISPLPFFLGGNDTEKSANESAWIVAPFFPGAPSATKTKQCSHCKGLNWETNICCAHCLESLL